MWLAKKKRECHSYDFGSFCERVENIRGWKRAEVTSSFCVTNLIPRAILSCNEKNKICALIVRHQLEMHELNRAAAKESLESFEIRVFWPPYFRRRLNDHTILTHSFFSFDIDSYRIAFRLCPSVSSTARKITIASFSFSEKRTRERESERELSWKKTSHVCFESLR